MIVIKICDHFVSTSLNGYDASDLIKSSIIDRVSENGDDFPFSLEDFIDELVEKNDSFEIIEDSHDWDVEFTPEEIDEIIDDAVVSGGLDEEDGDSEDDFDDVEEDEE